MKKVIIFLICLIGFVLVFAVSGYLTFNAMLDRSGEAATEAVQPGQEGEEGTYDIIWDTQKITRVTPGLNFNDAIITYGDEPHIVEALEEEVAVESDTVSVEEAEEKTKVEEVKTETKKETKVEEVKTETKKETKVEEVKTETKKETKVEEVKTETKKETKPDEVKTEAEEEAKAEAEEKKAEEIKPESEEEEKPKEEPVAPETEEPAEEEKVELNPNIQTSDSGL